MDRFRIAQPVRALYARLTVRLAGALLAGAIVGGALVAMPSPAGASGTGWIHAPMTPFQLGLTPPGQQLFDEETPVYGFRLNLLYGSNRSVGGLDLGLFGDAYGLKGIQIGGGNQVQGELRGLQLGLANSADRGAGVQIGVLNRTHSMKGLQIGILNWNDDGFLPVFPFFNFSIGGHDH